MKFINPNRIKPPCGNWDCSSSSGICESITHGRGELDSYGYWEFPCATCARYYEELHPQFGERWPFTEKTLKKIKKLEEANL